MMARHQQTQRLIAQALKEKNVTTPVKFLPGAPIVRLRSVQETFLQIQELDPITFLGKIMNGEPVPTVIVDKNGDVFTEYDIASMTDRRKAAEFLAAKLMPTLHAHKIIPGTPNESVGEGSVDDVFKRIVSKAIDKARDAGA
jgi:hypothetical protein